MASKTWNDGFADWTTAADWTPAGQPGAGDDVTIDQGNPEVTTQVGTVNSVSVTRNAGFGTLQIEGGALATTLGVSNSSTLFVGIGGSGGSLAVGGTLTNSGNTDIGQTSETTSASVSAAALANTGNLFISGDTTAGSANQASLVVGGAAGFGTQGVLTGTLTMNGNALLQFGSGSITSIAANGSLTISSANAVVADAGAATSKSALSGLASNAGSLTLSNGASITTATGTNLDNTGGSIDLFGGASAATAATLNVGGAAGLGPTAGVLAGAVNLSGNSLLDFAQGGSLTVIAAKSTLSIDGTSAFVADAPAAGGAAPAGNSALTGLASNAGSLTLTNGATIATTGAFANTGSIGLTGGFDSSGTPTTATLDIGGSAASFGPGGLLTGTVILSGASLLEFGSGSLSGIAANSSLSIGAANAFVADAGASTSNSALSGLASNAGTLSLSNGASVTTAAGTNLDNTGGTINLDGGASAATAATLDVGGAAGLGPAAGVLTGSVDLSGNSLLEFAQGGSLTSIAAFSGLSIGGTGAFVADAGNLTSNSALTGLTSNAGALTLSDGASVTATGDFANTGAINLTGAFSSSGTPPTTTLDIGGSAANFGPGGLLTGEVSVGAGSLLEFGSGSLSGVAAAGSLSITGANAFVAEAGATTSNSALSGLTSNAGTLSLNGTTVTTTGVTLSNTGRLTLEGASIDAAGATLTNTGSITLDSFSTAAPATLVSGGAASSFGADGLLTGQVTLSGGQGGSSLLEFGSGSLAGIAANSSLSIEGTNAFVADAGNTTANSALTGLASNAGALSLFDGASITTSGAFANTGSLDLSNAAGATAATTLDVGGSAASFGPAGALTGNVNLSGNSLLEFASGSLTGIAAKGALSIDGTAAFVADAPAAGGAPTSNSALTGLASNAGVLDLADGASVTTGALANTGLIGLNASGGATTTITTLDIGGTTADFGANGVLTGIVDLGQSSLLEFASGEITGIAAKSALSIVGTDAFVADAGALTSNSALTGLASNAGSLSLAAGATITTAADFSNTGSIDLVGTATTPTTLDIAGSAASFGPAGVLTGSVALSGNALLEFGSGSITGIAANSSLTVDGPGAFVADAGSLTSNSALTGLASNAGALSLSNTSLVTDPGTAFTNAGGSIALDAATLDTGGDASAFGPSGVAAGTLTGTVDLTNGSLLEFAGGEITGIAAKSSLSLEGTSFIADASDTASNSALTALASNAGTLSLSDGETVVTAALANTGTIDLTGGAEADATLDVTGATSSFGAATANGGVDLTGSVNLNGNALLEFGSGQITGIAADGALSIDGTAAFVADAPAGGGAPTGDSALSLASNSGTLSLADGASLATPGALTNTGTIDLNPFGSFAPTAASLTIGSAAGFGTAGVVTGQVNLGPDSLLEFTGGGELSSIAAGGGLSIQGSNAFVADAPAAGGAAPTSNDALTGLADNAGALSLSTGASIATTGALANSGTITLSGGSTLNIGGSASSFGPGGTLTGSVDLSGNALLEFAGGQIAGIAADSALSIDGTGTFIADAPAGGAAPTGNSALTGLASNAGTLTLADGASITTTGALDNTGTIDVSSFSGFLGGTPTETSLTIGSAAGFGTAGTVTGHVNLAGTASLEFAGGGELTSIAAKSSLSIDGTGAFVADAPAAGGAAPTGNSALTGLADNAGTLDLADGASIATTGALTNTGIIALGLGSLAGSSQPTTLSVGGTTAGFEDQTGALVGEVAVGSNSLLDFTQGGQIASIAQTGALSIDGTSAFVASGAATTSNSALTALASNAGELQLADGASLTTAAGFTDTDTGAVILSGGIFNTGPTTVLNVANTTAGFENAAGALVGQVSLGANSLLDFTQGGQITGIAQTGILSIGGTNAFVASGTATTSNSALTALASNAGELDLGDGVSFTTAGGFTDTGAVVLTNFANESATTLTVANTTAGFEDQTGALVGQIGVSADSLLDFAGGGQIASIAKAGALSIGGTFAFVASGAATTSNSAVTALASNAGTLALADGASLTTANGFTDTGAVVLMNFSTHTAPTTLTVANTTAGFEDATGALVGQVNVAGNSLLEFTGGGQITSIAAGGALSLSGATASVADAPAGGGAPAVNGALALASNAGALTVAGGASLATPGALTNTGTLDVLSGGTLTVAGTLASSGTLVVGDATEEVLSRTTETLNAGTLALTGGTTTVNIAAKVTASAVTLANDAKLELAGPASALSSPITFTAGAAATLQLDAAAVPASTTFADTIGGFSQGDTLDLRGLAFAPGATAAFDAATGVLAVTSNGVTDDLTLTAPGSTTGFLAQADGAGGTDVIVCFAAGTLIRTVRGDSVQDLAVETLAVGDHVVTASGARRPIRWLGHRAVDCRRHPRPNEVMPVRVAAHAFGHERPARDLWVSPGHALCVDAVGEVLIPAGALVNGSTVTQERVDGVTYWHVELDSHDILLAENMPCESYLEMGNRPFFAGSEATALHGSPDAPVATHAEFCRPFHQDGPVVTFVRERLAARAPDLGWRLEQAPWADLHLRADGRRLDPEVRDLSARFVLPADAEDVWLVSDTSVPAEVGVAPDLRPLGVCIGGLVVDDGFGAPRTIAADHPLLCAGFHDLEDGPQRWTAGRARLPAELWDGCRGSFFLRVDLTRPTLPRWRAPAADAGDAFALAG